MVSIGEEKSARLVGRRMDRALSILATTMLAGCTAQTDTDVASTNAGTYDALTPTTMTPTERLADDLAEADLAFENGDRDALAQRLQSIELAGAKPTDEYGRNALKLWRGDVPFSAPPMRGRVLGPAYRSGILAPGAQIETEQVLLGGKAVSIAAGTAPKGGLRLRIARGDGKTVCEQAPAHARECRFVPTYTQRYRIELFNAGKQNARYHLVFD